MITAFIWPAFNLQGLKTLEIVVILIALVTILVPAILVWKYAHILPKSLLWLDDEKPDEQPIGPLVFRIIGLYIFFTAIPSVVLQTSKAMIQLSSGPDVFPFYLFVGGSILFMLGGALTWRFSSTLAARVAGNAENDKSGPSISWDRIDLQVVAFSVVGLFIFVQAVPEVLVSGVEYLISLLPGQNSYNELFSIDIGQLFTSAAKAIVGLWLLFGSRGLVGLLRSYRDYGLKLNEEQETLSSGSENL